VKAGIACPYRKIGWNGWRAYSSAAAAGQARGPPGTAVRGPLFPACGSRTEGGEAFMKLWELLKKDHREVDQLFAEIEEADGEEQGELFTRIKEALQLHTKLEEAHFYPALKEYDETKEMAQHAGKEHGEVKELLRKMSQLKPGGDTWTKHCEELKTSVQHHVKEEETKIFPAAEKAIEEDELDEIAETIESEKEEAKAG
jgi:hemerythrin superfamily protein